MWYLVLRSFVILLRFQVPSILRPNLNETVLKNIKVRILISSQYVGRAEEIRSFDSKDDIGWLAEATHITRDRQNIGTNRGDVVTRILNWWIEFIYGSKDFLFYIISDIDYGQSWAGGTIKAIQKGRLQRYLAAD